MCCLHEHVCSVHVYVRLHVCVSGVSALCVCTHVSCINMCNSYVYRYVCMFCVLCMCEWAFVRVCMCTPVSVRECGYARSYVRECAYVRV